MFRSACLLLRQSQKTTAQIYKLLRLGGLSMKIKDEIRDKIIEDYKTGQYSYLSLAEKYGVSGTSIGRIVNPEYQEREREKNKLRQRNYEQPKAEYNINLRFYKQDHELVEKIKSVDNKQTYIKDLIREDIAKEKSK